MATRAWQTNTATLGWGGCFVLGQFFLTPQETCAKVVVRGWMVACFAWCVSHRVRFLVLGSPFMCVRRGRSSREKHNSSNRVGATQAEVLPLTQSVSMPTCSLAIAWHVSLTTWVWASLGLNPYAGLSKWRLAAQPLLAFSYMPKVKVSIEAPACPLLGKAGTWHTNSTGLAIHLK